MWDGLGKLLSDIRASGVVQAMLYLAIIAVVIGILAIPWFKNPLERLYRKLYDRYLVWHSVQRGRGDERVSIGRVESIRKGIRDSTTNDFFICDWRHVLEMNEHGYTRTQVNCLLVNITGEALDDVEFPAYFGGPPGDFRSWAKIGTTTYDPLEPATQDQSTGSMVFRIPFPTPLAPRKHIRVRYGYGWVGPYEEGDCWWEWYMARPHATFHFKYVLAPRWRITKARGIVIPNDHTPPQPRIHGKTLHWRINAPIPGRKYRVEYKLESIL